VEFLALILQTYAFLSEICQCDMPICPRSRKLHRVPQGLPPLMTAAAPLTLAILFSFSLDKYYYYFIFFILVLLLLLLFCR